MYRVLTYFISKNLIAIPSQLVQPLAFQIVIYFGVGLEVTVEKFFIFYLISLAMTMSASSIGMMLSCIFSNEEKTLQISPIIMMPMFIFSGFFANSGSYPE